jgi:hypothetical protein
MGLKLEAGRRNEEDSEEGDGAKIRGRKEE